MDFNVHHSDGDEHKYIRRYQYAIQSTLKYIFTVWISIDMKMQDN